MEIQVQAAPPGLLSVGRWRAMSLQHTISLTMMYVLKYIVM